VWATTPEDSINLFDYITIVTTQNKYKDVKRISLKFRKMSLF